MFMINILTLIGYKNKDQFYESIIMVKVTVKMDKFKYLKLMDVDF